jgi:hypothetical protein
MMEKKNSFVGVLALCLLLALLRGLTGIWPWIGFPLGVLFILFPKAAWIVTGGFYYLPVEPSNFALRTRQVLGVVMILWTVCTFAFGA